MRKLTAIVAAGFLWILTSCGTSNQPSPINAFWAAGIQNSNQFIGFNFSTNLAQTGGNGVTVSNFEFDPLTSCFSGQTVAKATFAIQTGQFEMTISTATTPPQKNVMTLQGTLKNSSPLPQITGTWNSSGSTGCSGSGTLSMNPIPKDPV